MSDERCNSEVVKDGLLFLAATAIRLDTQDYASLRRLFMQDPQKHIKELNEVVKFVKGVRQQLYDLIPDESQRIKAPEQGRTWYNPEDEEDDDDV